uniref:Uncharacterized protein n=1 Tax=Panagrolaimus davidi TaxID=227884 RepID=A0A914QFU8_9BILA
MFGRRPLGIRSDDEDVEASGSDEVEGVEAADEAESEVTVTGTPLEADDYENFMDVSEVHDVVAKSVRTVAADNSISGGQGHVHCNCKGRCQDKKCKCRRENRLCNTRCHDKLTCTNTYT